MADAKNNTLENIIRTIATELSLEPKQVAGVLEMIAAGATIPFMARYRKEATGSLDEVQLQAIRDRAEQLEQLQQRKDAIFKSLEERNLLTPELQATIEGAQTMTALEDAYLAYKPKRRTKATMARELGLEPLAELILEQKSDANPQQAARSFVNKEVADVETALQGARDIIAEWVSEDAEMRANLREIFVRRASITTKVVKGKQEEGKKYQDYFDWQESIAKVPSHRLLAMLRAENEGIIKLGIRPEDDLAIYQLEKKKLSRSASRQSREQMQLAIQDSYKRLIAPSLETEIRNFSKEKADDEAITVFVTNLRQLLLEAPLGQKRLLALDPGFRSGCKVVVLDEYGHLVANQAIYPHPPQSQTEQAGKEITALVKKHAVEVIAIGNGTAGRETERFVNALGLADVLVVVVSEDGASIYSASPVAREEFPDHDVTVRGAVSIGRRLMDPLAELVKIDAKSLGIGQYQHDIDQKKLKGSLDDTVMSCVNAVGVDVNSASKELLSYVSGLGPSLAKNIVTYRAENGPFDSRKKLLKVPRLGAKAYEQAAGFLRIRDAKNPLDASAVHPERYAVVEHMAKDLKTSVAQLIADDALRQKIDLKSYVQDDIGLPTLKDILSELEKPGRDPRESFEAFSFRDDINEMTDLREGMTLMGIVTNITDFGAFVDVGVHQDGLVHISQLANKFIKHPSDVVSLHQKVEVTVVSVEIDRKRIALSMIG